MTRTFAALVQACKNRTNLPKTKVEQTARSIQNAGLAQLGRGSIARPGDFANLILGISADTVRRAPATVNQYTNLKRLVESEVPKAGDAIEAWVTKIWSGDRDEAHKTLRIVQSWPEVILDDDHFYAAEQLLEQHAVLNVRRSIEIPGRVVAQIGADIGMRGCQYAI